jgi:hypothetical protein
MARVAYWYHTSIGFPFLGKCLPTLKIHASLPQGESRHMQMSRGFEMYWPPSSKIGDAAITQEWGRYGSDSISW